MAGELRLKIHGVGNAWPVPLGQEHPFYDRRDSCELANAAYSLELKQEGELMADILVDAGHGTIQSLLSGDNRIPHAIALTHGHMDHTLSVDWIVQSYRRFGGGTGPFPVYTTSAVYRFMLQSYPQLEELTVLRELLPGRTVSLDVCGEMSLTAFPVWHGASAMGASMLLFEAAGKRVLFTGDLLTPLLREEDYEYLNGVDVLVVDSNNRYPWPRTNHWSFAGSPPPADPLLRSSDLQAYLEGKAVQDLTVAHRTEDIDQAILEFLEQFENDWDPSTQPMTILELLGRINPQLVFPVHYSGAEDEKYYGEGMLCRNSLQEWMDKIAVETGFESRFYVAASGETILI